MISKSGLLFIEPQNAASVVPVIDDLTRRMTAAYRAARPGYPKFCGVHTCVCGAMSEGHNYMLPDRQTTNSLCVHYMAHHRAEVPAEQLDRVAALTCGMAEPAEEELRGGRWRGNRAGDYFGTEKVEAFAQSGFDLAAAYGAAHGTSRADEYFRHVFWILDEMPLDVLPFLAHAIRQSDSDIPRWLARPFWPQGWKEAWIAPLLVLLRSPDRIVRLWTVQSLGQLGDTLMTWMTFDEEAEDFRHVRASGFDSTQGQSVGSALLEVMLHDPDGKVRAAALHAIGRIGPCAAAAVPALTRIMQRSQWPEHRIKSIRALRNIEPEAPAPVWMPRAVAILTVALKDESKEIRSSAADALRDLGPEGCRQAKGALQEACEDQDPSVRFTANAALRSIGL